MKPMVFFIRKKLKKKIQNGRLKKVIFQLCQFSILFCENFVDWSLGLFFLYEINQGDSYEVVFTSVLWMVSSES